MRISKPFVALAATALVAFLAGCAGSSQFAPTGGTTTQSVNHAQPVGSLVRQDAKATLFGAPAIRTTRLSENSFHSFGTEPDKTVAVLFASDNSTGNVDEFKEDKPTNPIATCAGCGGWGLAVSPSAPVGSQLLAVGKSGGTVSIYKTLTGTPVFVASLTLSGGGSGDNAYGICFDDSGGLWADNWPSNGIDYFTAAQVNGGGGAATATIFGSSNLAEYYLACDWDTPKKGENILLSYGYDSSSNVNVDTVNTSTGAETLVANVGNLGSGTGFPGGIAVDKKDDLLANDQYGTLYEYAGADKWKLKGSCTWGFNPNDWTSIVFDDTQKESWAGDLQFSSAGEFAISTKLPLAKSGACKPGESGGPSTKQSGETAGYLGIAVYPNNGV
jgi:hypothetical protein